MIVFDLSIAGSRLDAKNKSLRAWDVEKEFPLPSRERVRVRGATTVATLTSFLSRQGRGGS
jgi:hypothetical protein